MELKIEKILHSIIKKSFLITSLILIILLSIIVFLYFKYLDTALKFSPQVTVENKIEENTLNKIIKNISERETRYLKSLKTQYQNPF